MIKSKFVRNVILVASGTAGAQAITMVFAPIITRLYGPEAFGLLGTFTATLAIVTPIAALSYPIAIVLPKSDDDAKALAKLSFRIALVMALSIATILLVAGDEIATLLGMQAIAGFMLLIPVAIFFNALQQIMQQWLIRKQQFKVTARIAVSQSLILNSTKSGLGWFYPFGSVLIVLATLGNALYAIQLWFGAKKWADKDGRIDKTTEKVSLKSVAKQHYDFPLYRAPEQLVSALTTGMPVLILSSYFGAASAGLYVLARTILKVPNVLLLTAIGNVFYPKIVEHFNAGKSVYKPTLKLTLVLFGIATLCYLPVIVAGPFLFKFIFGAEWELSGEYARWVAIWMVFGLSTGGVVKTIVVLEKQAVFLIYRILFAALTFVALYIGFAWYESILTAIKLLSLSSSIMCLLLIAYVLAISKIKAEK